ncbi:hypothetical protein ACHZ98_24565 [Streptomyces sp. MAR4 CNY-716]
MATLVQVRYTLTVLFEYAATLGLIDIENVAPEGAPSPRCWKMPQRRRGVAWDSARIVS